MCRLHVESTDFNREITRKQILSTQFTQKRSTTILTAQNLKQTKLDTQWREQKKSKAHFYKKSRYFSLTAKIFIRSNNQLLSKYHSLGP